MLRGPSYHRRSMASSPASTRAWWKPSAGTEPQTGRSSRANLWESRRFSEEIFTSASLSPEPSGARLGARLHAGPVPELVEPRFATRAPHPRICHRLVFVVALVHEGPRPRQLRARRLDSMTRWFLSLSPIAQGTLAGVGTWLLTALGSVPVLYARQAPRRLMDALMGFAGGVMVAAACWSLLVPALGLGGVWVAGGGLFAGAALIYALDQALPHLHPEFPDEARREGPSVARSEER